MDWTNVAVDANNYDRIKHNLPITYVLHTYGNTDVEIGPDGKGHAHCPFHQDSEPSLDIFGEHYDRWGCYPCSKGGDVFDLLRQMDPSLTFPQAVEFAEQLLASMPEGWKAQGVVKRTLDLASVQSMVANSQTDLSGLQAFIDANGLPFTAEQLQGSFGVGSVGPSVIIPYYSRSGELVTYKHRTLGTKPMSAPGSKFDGLLYGDWRDDGKKPVLLTEGESDAWSAAYYLSATYSVMGLPVGSGTRPDMYRERLAGRLVILAFDGDPAGRIATRVWAECLGHQNVRIVALSAGSDLRSLGEQVVEAVAQHRAVPMRPQAVIDNDQGTYYRVTEKSQVTLSNWTFKPERELRDEHGNMAYEGQVFPSGHEATITSQDLSTATRTLAWAVKQGGSWLGTDKDGRTLLSQFNAEGPFLEPARMSGVAGLHYGQFIWPGGQTGTRLHRWVSLGADTRLSEKVTIRQGKVDVVGSVRLLRSLHSAAVVDPILAWLAAAPLRSLRNQFPVLAVTGSSGTGKTTLTDALLRFFTGTAIGTNLTGTTRYGIEALVGSTNAFPVWVDEYRPGARADTAMAFQQILRDAYTGQGSVRGGAQDSWSTVVESPVHAPLVVTGENAFEETSHIERLINVIVPQKGRNPEALRAVYDSLSASEGVFAWTYLNWLTSRLEDLPGPVDAKQPEGFHLAPRVLTNLGILEWGWHLLERFVTEHGGELDAPDFSGVIRTAEEDSQHSPIEDALAQVQGEMDSIDIVFRRPEGIAVQVVNFVRYCIRSGIPLPGNDKAIKRFLIETYDGYEATINAGGLTKRVIMLPLGSI